MKKVLTVLILTLIIFNAVFADSVIPPGTTLGQAADSPAYINIALGINPSEMYYYTFGFSNKDGIKELPVSGMEHVPSAAEETLNLVYDPVSSTAQNNIPLYFYYKARTNQAFSLNIEILSALIDANSKNKLDWTVEFKPLSVEGNNLAVFTTDTISSSGITNTDIQIKPKSDEVETYAAYEMVIDTEIIPLLKDKSDFSSTLKLSVKSE